MFHALMARFQLELFIFITYFSIIVHSQVVFFFPVGLQGKKHKFEWDESEKIGNKNK